MRKAHCLVSTPGQLQGDVDAQTGVELIVVSLQGDASGGGIADDSHQLLASLEGLLLLNVDLHQPQSVQIVFVDLQPTCVLMASQILH